MKIEKRVGVTTLEQLHSVQRDNRRRLQAASNRVDDSLQAFEASFTIGNIFFSAVGGLNGLMRHMLNFRRGYHLIMRFFETLHRKGN